MVKHNMNNSKKKQDDPVKTKKKFSRVVVSKANPTNYKKNNTKKSNAVRAYSGVKQFEDLASQSNSPEYPTLNATLSFVRFLVAIVRRNLPLLVGDLKDSVLDAVTFLLESKENSVDLLQALPDPRRRWFISLFSKRPNLVKLYERYLSEEDTYDKYCYIDSCHDYFRDIHLSEFMNQPENIYCLSQLTFALDTNTSSEECFPLVSKQSMKNAVCMLMMTSISKRPPPMIVFPESTSSTDNCDLKIGHNKNDFISIHSLSDFLLNRFSKWLEEEKISKPVIVWSDLQQFPLNNHLFCTLEENGIILMGVPKNSSETYLPFESTLNKMLMEEWELVKSNWYSVNQKKKLKLEDFSSIFVHRYNSVMDSIDIGQLFDKCHLYPWIMQVPVIVE